MTTVLLMLLTCVAYDFAKEWVRRLIAKREDRRDVGEEEEENYNPLVNENVSSEIKVGDYVFASKYRDCDPGDAWAVGYVSLVDVDDIRCWPSVELESTGCRRWRYAKVITEEQGRQICEALPGFEHLPDGTRTMAAAAVLGPVLGGSLPDDDSR